MTVDSKCKIKLASGTFKRESLVRNSLKMDDSEGINSTVASRISEAEGSLLVSKQCQQNGLLSEVGDAILKLKIRDFQYWCFFSGRHVHRRGSGTY